MKFAFLFSLLFPIICFANPVYVTSSGRTYDEARHSGFREAIEYKIGSIVISEREQENLKLVRNNVLAYSAGYVDSFKVLSTEHMGNHVVVKMEVIVNDSRLQSMILSKPKDIHNFDNARHSIQYKTYIEQKDASDGFVFSVMRHYPTNALSLKQLPYSVKVDKDKNFILSVPYELVWNQNFVTAFEEMLTNIEDGRQGILQPSLANVVVFGKTNTQFLTANKTQYRFNDRTRILDIRSYMLGDNEARLRLVLKDMFNKNVVDTCYYPEFMTGRAHSFYALGDPAKIVLFAGQMERHSVEVVFPHNKKNIDMLDKISIIQLSIVSHKDCTFKTQI